MAEFAEISREGVPLITEHYEKVYDPLKNKTKQGVQKIKRMRTKNGGYESEESDEYIEHDGPPRRSQTERRRSPPRDDRRRSRRSGGDLVEERYIYEKGNGRSKSMGRNGFTSRESGRDDRRRGSRRDYSDSESSLSPPRRERRKSLGEKALAALGLGAAGGATVEKSYERRRSRDRSRRRDRDRSISYDRDYVRRDNRSRGQPSGGAAYYDDRTPARYKPAGYIRNGDDSERGSERGNQQIARRDDQSQVASRSGANSEYRGKKRDSSESSSSDASCSSTEDERRTKKMKGKEYLTAGLAAVATIHAAHGVYASIEARDKRREDVARGEITTEEARKKKNKARLHDAAAIGIAALGIKGAYSEWQEVQEHRHQLTEQQEKYKKHHEIRMKKRNKHGDGGGNRSEPDLSRRKERSYSR